MENKNNILTVSGSQTENKPEQQRKKPGRPKGSTNKPKTAKENQGSEQQEKRKRGRPKGTGGNKRPDSTVQAAPGENTKYLLHDLKLLRLPKIDVNSPDQVYNRIQEYITICSDDDIKPSIASLALSFSVSRTTLFNWMTGKSEMIKNIECLNTLKNAYDMINSYYEHMMNNGKINPVAGIFLMKNNMGYKDTTDHVITANQDNTLSLTDISNRAGLLDE